MLTILLQRRKTDIIFVPDRLDLKWPQSSEFLCRHNSECQFSRTTVKHLRRFQVIICLMNRIRVFTNARKPSDKRNEILLDNDSWSATTRTGGKDKLVTLRAVLVRLRTSEAPGPSISPLSDGN